MRLYLAAALLLAATSGAQAEPWQLDQYTINPGTFHSAVQYDASGDYAMVVQCHVETGAYELYVESPFEWDLEASYAPEVPAILTIDGTAISDVMFYFDEKQLGEGIRADTSSDRFGALLDRMAGARDNIALNYFDRFATFPADGIHAAMMSIADHCGR